MYFVTWSLLNWSKELTLSNDRYKIKDIRCILPNDRFKNEHSNRHRQMITNKNYDRCTHSYARRSLMQFGYEIRRKDCEIINANKYLMFANL